MPPFTSIRHPAPAIMQAIFFGRFNMDTVNSKLSNHFVCATPASNRDCGGIAALTAPHLRTNLGTSVA
jgi:hypothetical protein